MRRTTFIRTRAEWATGLMECTDVCFLRLTVGVSGEHSEAVRVHCTPG